jgi:hypothetical protein
MLMQVGLPLLRDQDSFHAISRIRRPAVHAQLIIDQPTPVQDSDHIMRTKLLDLSSQFDSQPWLGSLILHFRGYCITRQGDLFKVTTLGIVSWADIVTNWH